MSASLRLGPNSTAYDRKFIWSETLAIRRVSRTVSYQS